MVLPIIRDKRSTITNHPKKRKMAVNSKIPEGIERCKKKNRDIAKHLKAQVTNPREIVFELDQDIDKKLNSLVKSYEKKLDKIIEEEGVVLSSGKKKKRAADNENTNSASTSNNPNNSTSHLGNLVKG